MTPSQKIKIRFNTEKQKTDLGLPAWRVLVDGQERLAHQIEILAKSWTSEDEIAPGVTKWHICTEGQVEWNAETGLCRILPVL